MLPEIKKECWSYKTRCDDLISAADESQPSLLHCRIRAERICASLDELDNDAGSGGELAGSANALEAVSAEEVVDILKAFVFVILDFTFFVESDLAEKNFASDEAKTAFYRLLDDLDKPRAIYETHIVATAASSSGAVAAASSGQDPPPLPSPPPSDWPSFDEAVGKDLAECLYWRKGALVYMFHSATEARLATGTDKPELARLLRCGVENLKKMLSVRQEFKVIDNDAFVHDDGNTLQLIQRGLFSDTHVLALMYAGEMCFWFVKWVGEERTTVGQGNDCSDSK